ncbi:hypothetical protein QBC32DRAFT_54493 [Pseudoneurospora amorphoporcata]|uniref:DUF4484 domain-containing protein n=1 Tax=Pseudoneurospora amorphoporcata TaxID=241081 RepID=A0AAN6NME0_9PEZI|nr:hypothetical protein QBC32DRAFT_54493 [Pseudoneurospora amorphoporcata]
MAAYRRGQPSLSVRLPQPSASAALPDLPPISALFLIDFDVKAGYTIVWKQSAPGLELDGVVEYKSLPSGLHTVTDDLVYFVHEGGHAGLSAFVNARTDEEENRHARMIAVGVLVPLAYGRLGRSWRHADRLKDIASKLVVDRQQTHLLEDYWAENGIRDGAHPPPLPEAALDSPALSYKGGHPGPGKGHSRNRSASDGTVLMSSPHRLSPYHPAWSLTSLLDTFGPLIFPIHRAALLRKRILISTHAPVHEACNFVYDLSVLSNIPLSVSHLVDPAASTQRLRPLFNIGVHDIGYLLEHYAAMKRHFKGDNHETDDDFASSIAAEEAGSGWVACTTDTILTMKESLWDMLITLPPPHSGNAKERLWPTVECPKGVPVKATQRDLRRFKWLKMSLARIDPTSMTTPHIPRSPLSDETGQRAVSTPTMPNRTPTISLSRPTENTRPGTATSQTLPQTRPNAEDDAERVVEPTTWAALAYSGFIWWASAGEQGHSDEVDELAHDSALLADLTGNTPKMTGRTPRRTSFAAASSTGSNIGERGIMESVATLAAQRDGAQETSDDEQARIELAIIAYFHRLTTSILSVLADLVDSADDDDLLDLNLDPNAVGEEEYRDDYNDDDDQTGLLYGQEPSGIPGSHREGEGEEDEEAEYEGSLRGWVRVDSEALAHMGLDVWSKSDADFVSELTTRYFRRRAYVENKGVEVCGLKVC